MIRGKKLINKQIKRLRKELVHASGCVFDNCPTHAKENVDDYVALCKKHNKPIRIPRRLYQYEKTTINR